MSDPAFDIERLTEAERWQLIERLWASLGDEPHELTDAQRRGLDRRLNAIDHDVANGRPLGTPWHEVRARLFRSTPNS